MHSITNTLFFYETKADADAGVPTKISSVRYQMDDKGVLDPDTAETVLIEGNAIKADAEAKDLAVKTAQNVTRLKG